MAMADETNLHARAPRKSERTCVGCGKHADREDLVRLVLAPVSNSVVVDAKDGGFGRGAHLHPSVDCVSAAKKGLSRVFKRDVQVDAEALAKEISSAFARRLEGLLSGGARAGHIAVGGDMVEESLRSGVAKLVLVAADTRTKPPTTDALVFGDKMRLARALGRTRALERDGVGVCSITNVALATAVRRAWLCAVGLANISGGASSHARQHSRRAESAEARRADRAGGNE
jgi:predicted RNA-binding protein YlxR (DUF448 family)